MELIVIDKAIMADAKYPKRVKISVSICRNYFAMIRNYGLGDSGDYKLQEMYWDDKTPGVDARSIY